MKYQHRRVRTSNVSFFVLNQKLSCYLDSSLGQQSQVTELGWDWDQIRNFHKLGRDHCLETTLLKHWKQQESQLFLLWYCNDSEIYVGVPFMGSFPISQKTERKKLMCSGSSNPFHRSLNCVCMWDFKIHTSFLPLRTRMAQCPFCLSQISSYIKYQCVSSLTLFIFFSLIKVFQNNYLPHLKSFVNVSPQINLKYFLKIKMTLGGPQKYIIRLSFAFYSQYIG